MSGMDSDYFRRLQQQKEKDVEQLNLQRQKEIQGIDKRLAESPTTEEFGRLGVLKVVLYEDMLRTANELYFHNLCLILANDIEIVALRLGALQQAVGQHAKLKEEVDAVKKLAERREEIFKRIEELYNQQKESREKLVEYIQ
jgi:hypothetical protein